MVLREQHPRVHREWDPTAGWDTMERGNSVWSGSAPDATDTLTITLSGTDKVSAIILQADNNDAYQVAYWNGTGWTDLPTFLAVGGWG